MATGDEVIPNSQSITFLLVITLTFYNTTSTSAQFNILGTSCDTYPEFSNGSMYQTNLNTLFQTFVSNATKNPWGFEQTIVGNPAIEAVYGHYLCRGDQNTTSCHHCVTNATATDLPKICPNRKTAVIWYDECMVRYSNKSFFNYMDHSVTIKYKSDDITGNSIRFMEILRNMMNNEIAVQAPKGGLKKFATDFANYSDLQTIYGLGQCTPDLSPSDCNTCLMLSTQLFQESLGGRVIVPSCIVRYEMHPFFNLSYLPSPPLSSNRNKNISRMLIVIVPLLVLFAVVVVVVSICICRQKKKARKVEMDINNAASGGTPVAAQTRWSSWQAKVGQNVNAGGGTQIIGAVTNYWRLF